MATTLEPYLHFNGSCEEALALYAKAFKGEITEVNRYGDGPMSVPESWKKKLMHASFRAPGIAFMASDARPDRRVGSGDNVQLSVNHDDPAEQDRVWGVLSDGATVTMPLAEQFWGARFGMLVDRFGIHWMFNCRLKKTA
jgi:PhnB protein